MARLVRSPNKIKVQWTEVVGDREVTRSKTLYDEKDALTFKRLVEAGGADSMPPLRILAEHELIEYGRTPTATWVYLLRHIAFEEEWSAEERLAMLQKHLRDF